jgi:DNA polymerase-3 subunit chi
LIRAASPERLKVLDQALWTYDRESFLPHGTEEAGRAAEQPILLTASEANQNGAETLILVDHSVAPDDAVWQVIDYVFERNDPAAREAARQQWRLWKEQGHEPVYWETDAQGWRRAG